MATQAEMKDAAEAKDEAKMNDWDVWDEDVLKAIAEYIPDDIADIVFRLTDYKHVELDQHYKQQSLNVEIGNKAFWSDNKSVWSGILEDVSSNYCADCGQHKSRRVDSGRFSIGCRGRPVFDNQEQKPCRDLKYKSCDCHDCYECEEHFCTGHHRQCDKCTGTFLPDITQIWPNFKSL